jgi:hypothetical protein
MPMTDDELARHRRRFRRGTAVFLVQCTLACGLAEGGARMVRPGERDLARLVTAACLFGLAIVTACVLIAHIDDDMRAED